MALTVTVGAGVAAAYGAAALGAGALGLGALGIAALAGRRHGSRYRRGHGYHSHGNRYGRDVSMVSSGDDKTAEEKTEAENKNSLQLKKSTDPKKQLLMDEEQLLEAIKESDESGCSLRLVCELAGMDQADLTNDEWEILRFVRDGDPVAAPGQGLLPTSTTLAPYQSAARLGAAGYFCQDLYKACDLTGAQIMGFIEALL